MDVFIIYRDLRTYGLREDLYREARAKGVTFIRYDFDKGLEVAKDDSDLAVQFTSYILQRQVGVRPDLLVLATAIVPPQENPLAQLFRVPVNEDGFFAEAHVKLRPIDFAADGVFVCGLAHSPKPLDEAVAQGLGAAARAVTVLAKGRIAVEGMVSAGSEPLPWLRPMRRGLSLRCTRTRGCRRRCPGIADPGGALQGLRCLRRGLPDQRSCRTPLYRQRSTHHGGSGPV